jgi:hypothetical protein
MAPDWDQLAEDWKDDDVGLIGDVDCTDHRSGGGKELCTRFGIESFPTLKYGHPSDLEDYDGERDYADLAAFAETKLIPLCSVERVDLCEDERKGVIQRYLDMSMDDLEQLIEREEGVLEVAEETFSREVEELTKRYEAAEIVRKKTIADVVNGDLGLMRSIMLVKEKATTPDETAGVSAPDDGSAAKSQDEL